MDELLAIAREQGFDPTRRLVVDWVSLGLLSYRNHHGLGQGRGSVPGTWPPEQANLFLMLLTKRPEVRKISTLTNLPVGIWLYWGEPYVGLAQVRRALCTWSGRNLQVTGRSARRAAADLVADFGLKQGRNRAAFVDFVGQELVANSPDWNELKRRLGGLREGEVVHTEQVRVDVSPDAVGDLFSARMRAVRALPDFPDWAFYWGRHVYLEGRAAYSAATPSLMQHPRFSRLFRDTSLDSIFNAACVDLVTSLGPLTLPRFNPQSADLDSPRIWEANNLRSRLINTHRDQDGLCLEEEVSPASGEAQVTIGPSPRSILASGATTAG